MGRASKGNILKNEQSLAYKLLIPTILVLALVAIYPLGQVVITSFTNRVFASDKETEFVGFENYARLLGIAFRELKPITEKDTGEIVRDEKTGEIEYERAISVLPRTPNRYKELFQFNWFGKRVVVGARDREFILAVGNTLVFTIFSVLFETIIGLFLALVVNSNFKGKGIMRTTMLIPWAVITVVSARIWEWMLQPGTAGFFNMIIYRLGLSDGQASFLTNSALQMPTMIAVDVWKTSPYMALLILAGLQMIPKELYEASEVDGAGKIRQFFQITLPLLKPSLAVALIFRTLDALRVFDIFQVLMSSKMYSMASYNYFQLIQNRNMGLSSAVGVLIFLIIGIFSIFYIRSFGVDQT